jgi:acyl-CoA reductase-like NAD-dependent aldehyde dehydrogenase
MSAVVTSRSPQDPGDVVAEVHATGAAEMGALFARGRSAAAEWAAVSASVRAAALTDAAARLATAEEELSHLVVREVGKPVREARQEIQRGVSILRYQAQAALDADGETYPPLAPAPHTAQLMARRRPRGVAGLITPWNFPVAIPLWKAAPALAYGNAVVLKPAPQAVAVATELAALCAEVLPPDLLQLAIGGAETGEKVVAHADVVSFTGSTAAGAEVARAAAARRIPAQCEMGGCNATIVLPDADLDAVAPVIALSAMGYAGQKCTATSRIIAVGDPAPVREAVGAAIASVVVGDPASSATDAGPVIDDEAASRVRQAVAHPHASGGRGVVGETGHSDAGPWIRPTLVEGLAADARVAREEVFGPFAVVLSAAAVGDAVALANTGPYGLVTSVFTSDLDCALYAIDQLESGLIRVNQPTSGVDFHAPFGGEGDSSYGPREQGRHARELFTSVRTVSIAPAQGAVA